MRKKETGTVGVNVGALGVANHEQRRRLGIDWYQGDGVVAAFPADLKHSWQGWEPGCELIQVPGFPRHVVLAATHRRTSLYVIASIDEPCVRQALRRLSAEGDVTGFFLVAPRQAEYLTLGRDVVQALGALLRSSVEPARRDASSLTPPAALLAQLPDLFRNQRSEARRCNKHLAMYLYGDELLYKEALGDVIASAAPAR